MSKRIVVYGSYVTDLTARCEAFPTEGQTVKGSSFKDGPGGKGSNQAVAAHRAGADVLFISRIGRDHYGDEMLRFYQAEGMATDGIIVSEAEATGCALIMVNEKTSQNEIVVIPAACDNFSEAEIAAAAEKFLPGADLLVTQLETNFDANQQMLKA
ncbi:MAG: ribokinase, partial [Oscillospiraceae bacterium]|nr:ribokinase [Oscillospiraceae bacterium]